MTMNASALSFALGRTVATPGAIEAAGDDASHVLGTVLRRHASGDWSEMDEEDQQENRAAIADGSRILGAYTVAGVKFWAITEWDRSSTTVLLPAEY